VPEVAEPAAAGHRAPALAQSAVDCAADAGVNRRRRSGKMKLLRTAFVALALTVAFGALAFAESRSATDPEKMQVTSALNKDGYTMVEQVAVDNDQFTAYAKGKDGKNVKVRMDMSTMKVLKVEPVTMK